MKYLLFFFTSVFPILQKKWLNDKTLHLLYDGILFLFEVELITAYILWGQKWIRFFDLLKLYDRKTTSCQSCRMEYPPYKSLQHFKVNTFPYETFCS